jgi:hypothetical protein
VISAPPTTASPPTKETTSSDLVGKQYGYLTDVDTGARISQQFLP